jgi:hypothetical protein
LHYAVFHNQPEVKKKKKFFMVEKIFFFFFQSVAALLGRGAETTSLCELGVTPYQMAVRKNFGHIVQIFQSFEKNKQPQ